MWCPFGSKATINSAYDKDERHNRDRDLGTQRYAKDACAKKKKKGRSA